MNFRHRKLSLPVRHTIMLVAIPIALMSTGYALFSQTLSINANAANPAYSSSQDLLMTYDQTVSVYNSSRWEYDLTIYIQNNGTANINSWLLTFTIPSNDNAFKCFDDTVCSEDNGAVTINSGSSTGLITAGSTVSFTMRFRLTTDTNILQDINISGTYAPVYQTYAGLTTSYTVGARAKHQGVFYWPYTFTVTNNSGQDLSAWRILTDWDSTTNSVWAAQTDTTINYFEDTAQLRLLSTTGVANGDTFQFTASLGSTDKTWTLGSYSIEGAP